MQAGNAALRSNHGGAPSGMPSAVGDSWSFIRPGGNACAYRFRFWESSLGQSELWDAVVGTMAFRSAPLPVLASTLRRRTGHRQLFPTLRPTGMRLVDQPFH